MVRNSTKTFNYIRALTRAGCREPGNPLQNFVPQGYYVDVALGAQIVGNRRNSLMLTEAKARVCKNLIVLIAESALKRP